MAKLSEDDIDDILYFARTNQLDSLQDFFNQLSESHGLSKSDVTKFAVDLDNGNSAIHYASANGHIEIVKFLLQAIGAKEGEKDDQILSILHLQNKAGNTPLHWAALNGHEQVLLSLLQHGADPSILNAAGHDALFEAELNEKTKAAEILLSEGKELESTVNGNNHDQDKDQDQDHDQD